MNTPVSQFEATVLRAVAELGSDAYGLPIYWAVERMTGRSTTLGMISTTLERLEDRGLVRSWEGEATPERGWRAKRYFALEQVGRQALEIPCTDERHEPRR